MTINQLSPDQLESLLPALPHVAELVQNSGKTSAELVRNSGVPSRADLQKLLGRKLATDWAIDELQGWAEELANVRRETFPGKRDLTRRYLMTRGIPEDKARSAVETAATVPEPPSSPAAFSLRISFPLPDLEKQGMQRRLGRGKIYDR